ncbi:DUF2969 domain-containing protein [Streptococcus cuniculipharyngis]|uniref:DUF2969 domain-containing protein n=1 Tax=Streptococcus cuniculipharyngis TaxID=1562651 RepID=A0A5C5S907_9STRE|nr:DUF2969 domain-containing protein [Streptococcus cuniculipharyngis]TWS96896.1 DUF2969 domain-containing protein [Streptococcus cuniculipharyngis]
MSKKDKKIEVQVLDAKVEVNGQLVAGYHLVIGKKIAGQLVELDKQFAVIKQGAVDSIYKTFDQGIEHIIEAYNLNH